MPKMIANVPETEPLDSIAWPLEQDWLPGWLANPLGIGSGDPAALAGLFTGPALVGLAMEAHGTSRPASSSDHKTAHL
jgi:glycerol-1-phosphate dehydrogenase [NAD(P)+]